MSPVSRWRPSPPTGTVVAERHVTAPLEDCITTTTPTPAATGIAHKDVVDWTDLGKEMWSYLTGKGAAIDYTFVDMSVEVPRDTGPDAPRATWKLNGTLRITTTDRDNA
jgi:hypothetical protein